MQDYYTDFRRLINILKTKVVPDELLESFTVGDFFRRSVHRLASEILTLRDKQGAIERILAGGFGTGKTHFLNYLQHLIVNHAGEAPDVLISRVDLGDLRNPNDLQYHVVVGLRRLTGERYGSIFDMAYGWLEQNYLELAEAPSAPPQPPKSPPEQSKPASGGFRLGNIKLPGKLKDLINEENLENLRKKAAELGEKVKDTMGQVVKDVAERLDDTPMMKNLRQTTRYNQMMKRAADVHDEHVVAFLTLCDNDYYGDGFRDAARKLSFENRLSDAVFKVLRMVGIQVIVILVDELEAVASLGSAHDPTPIQKTLTAFRDFRDELHKAGKEDGYPSIACIVTSPNIFLEKIETYEPALWSRWEAKVLRLDSSIDFQNQDFEDLARQLRGLYSKAGYRLSSLEEEDLAKLRDEITAQLEASQRIGNMREVILRIMEYIETEWQR